MLLYHGTDKISSNVIQGPPAGVDVTKGGGELGRGFYLGDNMTLAISWAKGRKKKNASVLEFDINNSTYATLAFKQMGLRAVKHTWRQLKISGTSHSHTFGFDIVFGPLATNSYAAQYKFESIAAEALVNNSTVKTIL
jgi:Protein of unknown function (DUF3990)